VYGGSRGHLLHYGLMYDGMGDNEPRLAGLLELEILDNDECKFGFGDSKFGSETSKFGSSLGQVCPKFGSSLGSEIGLKGNGDKGLRGVGVQNVKNALLEEKNT